MMETKIDPATGYRHEIDPAIVEAYLAGAYPKVISKCMQEWSPTVAQLADTHLPKCPVCYPARKEAYIPLPKPHGPQRAFYTNVARVEAMQLVVGEDHRVTNIVEWGASNGVTMEYMGQSRGMLIKTSYGDLVAHESDWIVRNADNFFYPVRTDIFWTMHEAAYDEE